MIAGCPSAEPARAEPILIEKLSPQSSSGVVSPDSNKDF
jgi:hypothetical protein